MKSEPARSPNRASPFAPLPFLVGGLLAIASASGAQNSQLPPVSQVQEMLQQNPQLADLIRQRLQQSGMTADQIRVRLRAAGYPDTLLNAYLGSAGQSGLSPGMMQLTAMQALGMAPLPGQSLPMDTGM